MFAAQFALNQPRLRWVGFDSLEVEPYILSLGFAFPKACAVAGLAESSSAALLDEDGDGSISGCACACAGSTSLVLEYAASTPRSSHPGGFVSTGNAVAVGLGGGFVSTGNAVAVGAAAIAVRVHCHFLSVISIR